MNPSSQHTAALFINEDHTDHLIWIKETPAVAPSYKGKYAFELEDIYHFQELPEELWGKAYWHGHKIMGAWVHDYSSDASYTDVTVILWLSKGYNEANDLLPSVEVYSFSIDAEDGE